jgi:hypothetical protein
LRRLSRLSTRPIPRLPTPRIQAVASPAEDSLGTNLYQRIKGAPAKLGLDQVDPYLEANGRNAASLLAAYRTTGDGALLDEAMQKYPKDPQVAFEAAFRKEISPEERAQWLKAFKEADPENSLAYYLSAAHSFKSGQTDQAVQDLIAASGKSQFLDYTLARVQDDEEAYRTAGYSVAEAKTIPAMQLLLPQLAEMKSLSGSLTELANSYRQAGDAASAQAALEMATALGARYSTTSPGEPEISQLVGIAIERTALKGMEPGSFIGNTEVTVTDRLNQLAKQWDDLQQLATQTEALLPKVSGQDLISYKDRWRNFGEAAAGQWLIQKYGQK